MALLAELQGKMAVAKRPKLCTFGEIRANINDEEREALDICVDSIIADKDIPNHRKVFTNAWLVEVLNRNGYTIGKTTVSDHIAGRCACQVTS